MSLNRMPIFAIAATVGIGCPLVASAGDPEVVAEVIEVEPESLFSGTLSLDGNSHFVSYGFDVWGGGTDLLLQPTFNPSLELSWAFTENFSMVLGTWWDVNDHARSGIGGDLQEVDVWGGGSYDFGLVSLSAVYQAWMYASGTEQIVDVGLSFDTFLSPSLLLHNRVDPGSSGGQNGQVLVAGIEYGFDVGCVSLALPLNVAYFFQDDYHPFSTDSGIGYISTGVTASVPLSFISSAYGDWDLHGGLLFYFTDDDVVANPKDDNFLTANIGISCAF